MIFWQIDAICKKYGHTLKTPVKDLCEEALGDILNGTNERLVIENETMATNNYFQSYDGLVKYIEMQQADDASASAKKWSEGFFTRGVCPECKGDRLNKEALHFFVDGKNIADLCRMDISDLYQWCDGLEDRLSPTSRVIAAEIMKEVRSRLRFLIDVGLDYLQLSRASATLSGGESQRIRLATQLGSQLVNVLYILDEPSIGLHQRDNRRLIDSLKSLRDASNSILVVEHDKDIMLEADHIVDIGPKAGRKGGEVVFSGSPAEMLATTTLTAQYLNGTLSLPFNNSPRKGNGKRLCCAEPQATISVTSHSPFRSANLSASLECRAAASRHLSTPLSSRYSVRNCIARSHRLFPTSLSKASIISTRLCASTSHRSDDRRVPTRLPTPESSPPSATCSLRYPKPRYEVIVRGVSHSMCQADDARHAAATAIRLSK